MDFKISASQYASGLDELLQTTNPEEAFPNLMSALSAAAGLMQQAWVGFASGVPIPGSPRVINSRGTYKASIKLDISDPTTKVVFSDSIINKYIEDGAEAVDLKPGLLSGKHAKFGKYGPYNVVAFRHDTPNSNNQAQSMPLEIYKLSQNQPTPLPKGGSREVIGPGSNQGQRTKLTAGVKVSIKGENFTTSKILAKNYTWKTGKFASMRQYDTSTGKAKRSQYITFRCVSYRSDPSSWIRPAQEGIPIRQAVVDVTRDAIEELIRAAIVEDLKVGAK